MSREEFIFYPALSASRIKKHYTGDISYAKFALAKGADFHNQILEMELEQMNEEASNVHRCIMNHPIAFHIFNGSSKEVVVISTVNILGNEIPAKAMLDIHNTGFGIIADIKTTSAKTMEAFQSDMIKHYNHIQAAWFAKVAGVDPSMFFYIGVPARAKQFTSNENDIFVFRHNEHDLQQADALIEKYIREEWKTVRNQLGRAKA
jgi:hypothetical protein